jgi:hypothetical protein
VTLTDESILLFRNVNNLYICNIPKDIVHFDDPQSNSFSFHAKSSSSHEAELLIRKLGYPSDRSVEKALQNGSIHNTPCTSTDIYSMRRERSRHLRSYPRSLSRRRMNCLAGTGLVNISATMHSVGTYSTTSCFSSM